MRESEKGPVVLVAAKEDLLNDLKDALSNTNFLLLHAPTKQEAIAEARKERNAERSGDEDSELEI